jgi:hypothetical protein
MKILYKDTKLPFDKPRAEALAMIAAGLAEAYVESAPVRVPKTTWSLQAWSYNDEPYINAACATCGQRVQMSGPSAHRTQVFQHCGVAEKVPSHLQEQYVERRKKFVPKPIQAPVVEGMLMIELQHFA